MAEKKPKLGKFPLHIDVKKISDTHDTYWVILTDDDGWVVNTRAFTGLDTTREAIDFLAGVVDAIQGKTGIVTLDKHIDELDQLFDDLGIISAAEGELT